MRTHFWMILLGVAILPGTGRADDWKDESGHGRGRFDRGWGQHFGEPPAWERGRGYWDGHFRHPDPHPRRYFIDPWQRPRNFQYQYAPPIVRPKDYEDWVEDYEDRREDRREHLEDLREKQKEAYEDWLKDRRDYMKELRKRQKKHNKRWR